MMNYNNQTRESFKKSKRFIKVKFYDHLLDDIRYKNLKM